MEHQGMCEGTLLIPSIDAFKNTSADDAAFGTRLSPLGNFDIHWWMVRLCQQLMECNKPIIFNPWFETSKWIMDPQLMGCRLLYRCQCFLPLEDTYCACAYLESMNTIPFASLGEIRLEGSQ